MFSRQYKKPISSIFLTKVNTAQLEPQRMLQEVNLSLNPKLLKLPNIKIDSYNNKIVPPNIYRFHQYILKHYTNLHHYSVTFSLEKVSALPGRASFHSFQNITPEKKNPVNFSTLLTSFSLSKNESNNIYSLCLTRIESRNAISLSFLTELEQHLNFLKEVSPPPRALIIWSACDNVFCAGADLKERLKMTQKEALNFLERLNLAFSNISSLPFPTIACIDGGALGGGLELALACDFRVASSSSYFVLPEASLAIIPGAGGTQRLPRLIGAQRAKIMAFTAQKINSEQAREWNLIDDLISINPNEEHTTALLFNSAFRQSIFKTESSKEFFRTSSTWSAHVSQQDEKNSLNSNFVASYSEEDTKFLLEAFFNHLSSEKNFKDYSKHKYSIFLALRLVNSLLKNSPSAISSIKNAIIKGSEVSLENGLKIENENYKTTLNTKDRIEALTAFKEKRPPNFSGN